jgi:hypothetical protein
MLPPSGNETVLNMITKFVRHVGHGGSLACLLLALPVAAWGALPTVKLTAANKVVQSVVAYGSTASATFRLASAGKIRFQTSVGGLYNEQAPFDEWLEPESATESVNYEVQAILIDGLGVIGPINQWVQMGMSPVDWTLTRSAIGTTRANIAIQIRRVGTITALASTTVTLTAMVSNPAAPPAWEGTSGTHVGIPGFEASGAVWEPRSGKLVLVSDTGMVYNGSDPTVKVGGDLESIATTGDGFLYAGVEGGGDKPTIVELSASPLTLLKDPLTDTSLSWRLTNFPATSSTKGMEGLTWVPDGQHPYGVSGVNGVSSSSRVFYTSSMTDGKIYAFRVDLGSPGSTPALLNPGGFAPLPGQTDISDLYYDPGQRILFVLYDSANRLVQVDISKPLPALPEVIASDRLPATPNDQEGVTFSPSCTPDGTTSIFLADDPVGNGYYAFNGFPGVCATDADQARIVAITAPPLLLEFNKSALINITVKNTGTSTWSGGTFGLFPIEGQATGVFLNASESIAPGQTKTFGVVIFSGNTAGQRYFRWRMFKGGKWFGSPSPEISMIVFNL